MNPTLGLGSLRRALGVVLFLVLALSALQAGCGSSTNGSEFSSGGLPPAPGGPDSPGFGSSGGLDGSSAADVDPDALGTLVVSPPTATVAVTIVDGVVTAKPTAQFTASYNGQVVAATWLLDRGELGDIDAAGVFTASGATVGEGAITARFGAREGTAKVKVTIAQTQNGAPAGVDAGAGGFGGLGGVGGEPLGAAVDPSVVTKLKGTATPPASEAELGFLYPYDKTVWPRGLLPPLLMWQTTHEASAVYVKLSQGNYTFEGTYSVEAQPSGSDARKRVRLQEEVWKTATEGNEGDDLVLEVRIYTAENGGTVVGPITRTWKVAPGVLKGTVYYNSYDSLVTSGGGAEMGGVIAIKPRSPDPTLAIPYMAGKCHVCHTVSADGSTLFVQDGKVDYPDGPDDYRNGASYDLTKNPIPRTDYLGAVTPSHDRKFVWSGPYPDGSFALVSSRFAREAYLKTDAKLFDRAAGAEIAAPGLEAVASTVTPTFSPDGRKVAFNFWEGPGANGVSAGGGHSLAVFDFTCGAPAGSTTCAAAAAHTFSGLREIYKDPSRYPAWPSFLPDGKAAVFHNTLAGGACGPGMNVVDRNSEYNCMLTTWYGAQAEIWLARDGATQDAQRLDALNGIGIVPTNGTHPDDTKLNFMPTVNPVASGGYYWVVFTSRRMYGNLLTGAPDSGPQKKLWVAAIDINAPAGADPSHPAFYLPGQELSAGNSRGFWVVDPCKANGSSCETGDECCNGFCRKDGDGGGLVCQDKPPGATCVQEFEKCTVDADCCDPKFTCIAGKCSRPDPIVK